MVRKILALLATGLILFAALLIQMSAVQAAAPRQIEPDPALEEPQPLPQPLRIRINQRIPLTLNLPSALLESALVTRPLTATNTLTDPILGNLPDVSDILTDTDDTDDLGDLGDLEDLTGVDAITETDELTEALGVLTTTGSALGAALADAIASAAEAITDTDTLTDTDTVIDTDTVTDTDELTDTIADALTDDVLDDLADLGEDDVLTTTVPMVGVPVTLELTLDLVVTNTLTSTVPSSVTLQLADNTTRTLPISVSVAALPDGEVFIELLPLEEIETETPEPTPTATEEITDTADLTDTAEVTDTLEVTTTAPTPSGLPVVQTTATTTANLRAGPATTFDLIGQVGLGQTLSVVAVTEDGEWYLLDGGAWIATFLTANPALPGLPTATQEIIDQASGVAPVPPVAETPLVTDTVEATPVPPVTTVVTPTTTTDANLRAGPGTEFPVIGGTVINQQLSIVGRNADSTWWRLDNAGWIFGELVANPPVPETVPVVAADGTVLVPVPPPAAPAPGGLLLPTPTPAAAGVTTTTAATTVTTTTVTTATAATTADANYVSAVEGILESYDGIVQTLDSLIADARRDETALTNPDWANRVNATLILLRRTAASVGELAPPAGLTAAQESLIDAAREYTNAGNALSQAASTAAVAQLDVAETAIEAANASLVAVEEALR